MSIKGANLGARVCAVVIILGIAAHLVTVTRWSEGETASRFVRRQNEERFERPSAWHPVAWQPDSLSNLLHSVKSVP